MKEIWKDIHEYEGLYQVSNLGRVKGLERYRKTKHLGEIKSGYIQKEAIKKQKKLKPNKTSNKTSCYLQVTLCKDGKSKLFLVHRLVAEAFIPNPDNKPYVNHKDGNRENNIETKLEWTTNKENQDHSVQVLKHSHNKPIMAFDKKTLLKVFEFEVMGDASKWLLDNGRTKDKTCLTAIIKCCKGKIPSYMGYIWIYKKDVEHSEITNELIQSPNNSNRETF